MPLLGKENKLTTSDRQLIKDHKFLGNYLNKALHISGLMSPNIDVGIPKICPRLHVHSQC